VHGFGFGAMPPYRRRHWGPPTDRKGALAVLRRACEHCISIFIDTADSYGPSRKRWNWIARSVAFLTRLAVITNRRGWTVPGPNQMEPTMLISLAPSKAVIAESLKRLRLARIDVCISYTFQTPSLI